MVVHDMKSTFHVISIEKDKKKIYNIIVLCILHMPVGSECILLCIISGGPFIFIFSVVNEFKDRFLSLCEDLLQGG